MNQLTEDSPSRAHSLGGLRRWAALFVVFYHSILLNDLPLIDRVLHQPIQSLTSSSDLLAKFVPDFSLFDK